QNELDEAIADFDAALKLDPDDTQLHQVRGVALSMAKRMDEAREAFAKATELQPQSIAAWLQKDQRDYLAEEFASAAASAGKVLKLDSDNIMALLLRAQALAKLKQF